MTKSNGSYDKFASNVCVLSDEFNQKEIAQVYVINWWALCEKLHGKKLYAFSDKSDMIPWFSVGIPRRFC